MPGRREKGGHDLPCPHFSKKVHSSYLLKAQKGQFTGCLAPFGYQKDPEDKNHLLIDEETAPFLSKFILISNPSRKWSRSQPDLPRRGGS